MGIEQYCFTVLTVNTFFAGFICACIQLSRAANITTEATLGIFLQKELSVSEFIPGACKLCFLGK